MKILSAAQILELDAYTIKNEPIASIDLMECASLTFTKWFVQKFPDINRPVFIFCGIGNNGGDGLAVARLLYQRFYNVEIFWCKIGENTSEDFSINLKRLPKRNAIPVYEILKGDTFPTLSENAIIIDAVFGSGLNRPVTGYWGELFTHLNLLKATRVAIDIPSGLFTDQHTEGICIEADYTFSFEMPKLSFLFSENQNIAGDWHYESIGLDASFIKDTSSAYFLIDEAMVKPFLKERKKFDHKGTFGHALLIMGSYGKVGAAVLAAKSCLKSGAGLTTVHAPKCAYEILQISFPEAMVSVDRHKFCFSQISDLTPYNAIGVSCGLSKNKLTVNAIDELLDKSQLPLVLDADALNIIARNQKLMLKIPRGTILTPHPKEFERLFGKSMNEFERCELQRNKSEEHNCYIILKGANTAITTPEGICYFNSTGNPGMATAGSGDVLTGIITGLLAQEYTALEASILGVYIHGLAGDLAVHDLEHESMLASDIITFLGKAFQKIRSK